MKKYAERTVKRGSGFRVYEIDGRYYLDLHHAMQPIHSFSSLLGIAETLYYQGLLPDKTLCALMNA